jgi:hypothetical protein
MQKWDDIWRSMQADYQRLQDSRVLFDAAFKKKRSHLSVEAAQAAVDFAQELCRFLNKFAQRGVFDALLESPASQSEARDHLIGQLQECLRVEAVLLERAGLKPEQVQPLMDDIRAIAHPPYPTLAGDLWQKHVDAAVAVACNFPRSSIVLMADNAWDYVQDLRKKYQWVSAAVVGVANMVTASQDPTLVAATKVSKYLAVLLAVGHRGEGGPPGTSV